MYTSRVRFILFYVSFVKNSRSTILKNMELGVHRDEYGEYRMDNAEERRGLMKSLSQLRHSRGILEAYYLMRHCDSQ